MKRAARGFSALELLFVVLIVGTLMVVLLERVAYYQEFAEKDAMERVAGEIRWALRIRAAELMLANRSEEMGRLETANPLEALELRVPDFAGVGNNAGEASVAPGHWYYNRESRELAYFPRFTANFVKEPSARARVAWRVVVIREAPRPGAPPRPVWVRFEASGTARWLEQR